MSAAPLPRGFRIVMDSSAKPLTADLWHGGSPPRVLRLTAAGRSTLLRLRAEGVRDESSGRLARRLTDAGLAHPVPPSSSVTAADVTVVVPVLDRAAALDRCLTSLARRFPVIVVDDGSTNAGALADVARRHGARVIRRAVNGGPAAARNIGVAAVRTALVAFVDSDCAPGDGWIDDLAGHLADPAVAAVAPRVTTDAGSGRWLARYHRSRGVLDLGDSPALVRPRGRVSYVPTAALLARTDALRSIAIESSSTTSRYVFDPALRYGEDVDLVWRLHEAGWRVRYDPGVEVTHRDPDGVIELLRRRYRYGTSAAPLGRAHPDAIAPLVLHPWTSAAVAVLLGGRLPLAAAAFTGAVSAMTRTLRRAGVPTTGTTRAVAGATAQTWLGIGRYLTQFASPALLVAALAPGRPGRRLAASSLLFASPLVAWWPRRRSLDPVRFTLAHLADEIAYGAGVWRGAVRHRTLVPLRPVLGTTRAVRAVHASTRSDLARSKPIPDTPSSGIPSRGAGTS